MSEILNGGLVHNFPTFQRSASQSLRSPLPSISPFIHHRRHDNLPTAASLLRPPHHPPPCRSRYPTPSSTARDGRLSSTALDQDPFIASSRFIGAVVHLVVTAPTTGSSTATRFIPRPGRLPSKVFFPAADSHRTRSTPNVSA